MLLLTCVFNQLTQEITLNGTSEALTEFISILEADARLAEMTLNGIPDALEHGEISLNIMRLSLLDDALCIGRDGSALVISGTKDSFKLLADSIRLATVTGDRKHVHVEPVAGIKDISPDSLPFTIDAVLNEGL